MDFAMTRSFALVASVSLLLGGCGNTSATPGAGGASGASSGGQASGGKQSSGGSQSGGAQAAGGSTTSVTGSGGGVGGAGAPRGGTQGAGGSTFAGGTGGTGTSGTPGSGGTKGDAGPSDVGSSAGGTSASGGTGGSAGSGGTSARGGTVSSGGATSSGGVSGSGGTSGSGGGATSGNPFGCKFGWGEPSPANYSWLQWVTNWMGQSIKADGSVSSCETCSWLQQLASTNLIPAYYAYIIGFYGHVNGLPDGNQSSGPNLTTGGGALILGAANSGCPSGQICDQNKIVQAYAYYAKQSHAAWPTKPLIWLLEGDYVQYSASTQSQPLTYQQLGQLAALITTAIKTNMPNAVVAMDHSPWNSDDVTNSFWNAMKQAKLDLAWTTGVGNNNGFMAAGTNASSYNGKTATYAYLRTLTGMKILVDESAGLSQASDTWSNQSAATINARISEGVIGINVSGAPSNYQSNVAGLSPQLNSTCP